MLEVFKMFSLVLSLLISAIVVDCATDPIVSTRYGPVQGITGSHSINNETLNYQAFLGIPFAEPPVEDKRFQLPVSFNATWTSPYQATHFHDACVQNPDDERIKVNISEDCLYLNIWRPELDQADPSGQLLPVYYFIHGSAFTRLSGATPFYQGDVLASTQKIIFVNSNFRLGVFGFGYGSPDEMPGNVGIYDTLLVLQWIQDNIKSFGGDPNRVTLSGLSSGADMITILSGLPEKFNSKSLFSRAIMMSGSAVDHQQVESSGIGAAKTRLLASKLNCLSQQDKLTESSSKLSAETINCLKKQPADVILQAQNSKDINAIGANAEYVFLPVYGTPLIPDPAIVNHKKRLNNSANMSMLFGSEQDESKPFPSVDAVVTLEDAYNYTKEEITYAFKKIAKGQIDSIFGAYFTGVNSNDTHDLRSRCVQLTSDVRYTCPSLILSQLFSLVSDNVFLYENVYFGQNAKRPFGSQHNDDTIFGQGSPYRAPDKFTQTDRQYSSILMKIFGDFTKGIPFNDWTPVKFNKSDPNALQTIKRLSLTPINVLDQKQKKCMGWAKLFKYQIP